MTGDDVTPGRGHLGEEELSDLVDGRADPSADAHLASCPACAARLDGWRVTVRRLAEEPCPVPDRERDAAVSAALAAAPWAAPDRPPGARTGRRAGRRLTAARWLPAAGGLAAAAAVVVGAVVGLRAASNSSSSAKTSSAGPTVNVPVSPSGASSAATPAAVGVDLGSIGDPSALARAVQRALAGFSNRASAVPSATSGQAPGASRAPVAGPPGCQAPPGIFPGGSTPSLLLRATAVYRSVPAQVLVYQVGGQRRVVVMADRDCSVLGDVAG
jgi:hypothetical protein